MIENTYDGLYLKKFLTEEGDPRADDDAFINERVERSGAVFEECRLQGMTVDQAQEAAMAVLLEGLSSSENDEEETR